MERVPPEEIARTPGLTARSRVWKVIGSSGEASRYGYALLLRNLLPAYQQMEAGLERQLKEFQLETERLMREKAERDARQKETELELEQIAHKLAEAQRQRLASQVPVRTGKIEQSIFVSFASPDRSVAIEVYEWLVEQGGERISLDLEKDPFLASERRSGLIRASRAIMLLLSPAWAESRYCLQELEIAREARAHLIAVRIGPFDPSGAARSAIEDVRVVADWSLAAERELLKARLVQLGLLEEYFTYVSGRSPYPGLAGFEEEDAAVFFGRSAQIDEAIDRLTFYRQDGGCHVLSILGASGAGKSSFLRAGIWPRLRRDRASFFCLPILRPRERRSRHRTCTETRDQERLGILRTIDGPRRYAGGGRCGRRTPRAGTSHVVPIFDAANEL
jgi:hypothetical protein